MKHSEFTYSSLQTEVRKGEGSRWLRVWCMPGIVPTVSCRRKYHRLLAALCAARWKPEELAKGTWREPLSW